MPSIDISIRPGSVAMMGGAPSIRYIGDPETEPLLMPILYDGDTIADAFEAWTYDTANYVAAGGASIVSAAREWNRNGAGWEDGSGAAALTDVLDAEDTLRARVRVTDDLGRERVVNLAAPEGGNTTTVQYPAVAFSSSPTLTPALDETGQDFTLDVGAADFGTFSVEYFTLGDEDASGDLTDNMDGTYTYTGATEGLLRAQVRLTYPDGQILLSSELTARVNDNPVITNFALNTDQLDAELSKTATMYYLLNSAGSTESIANILAGGGDASGSFFCPNGIGSANINTAGLDGLTRRVSVFAEDQYGGRSAAASVSVTFAGAVVPDAFASDDWSLSDPETGTELDVTISLPADNGATITDVEFRVDGGTWTSSGGTTSFTITGLTEDVEVDIELRAQSANGPSAASDVKSATPTSGAALAFVGLGTAASGTGSVSAPWPAGHAAGDVAFCIDGGRDDEAPFPTPTTGWSAAYSVTPSSPTSLKRALKISTKTASGASEADAAIADVGNHQLARVAAFHDVTSHAQASSSFGSSAAPSLAGFTPTAAGQLLVAFILRNATGAVTYNSITANGGITDLALEAAFQTSSGDGSEIVILRGTIPDTTPITAITIDIDFSTNWAVLGVEIH